MIETLVLLLADIVDSTHVTERLGEEAAADLWAEHDSGARALLRPWRGREIDKSDGLFAIFFSVSDALGYAAAYHVFLASLQPPLQARAAVHAGSMRLRETPAHDVQRGAKPLEVDGLAKPMVARLMAIAAAGQTLLSDAACSLLAGAARKDWNVRSCGHWQLKGIESPVELFALGEQGAALLADAPKAWRVMRSGDLWLPVRPARHTLPAEQDAFVGRAATLLALGDILDGSVRLVSLLGIGGIGKTRVAQRFGWLRLGAFTGGVWFCDLSAAKTLEGIAHAVALGLDLPIAGADPLLQIGHAIAGRGDCLLIVDNFEQLTRFAEVSIGTWMRMAGAARFIVTTREVLGISGEHLLEVPPLSDMEGSSLFLQRSAAALGRSFDLPQGGADPQAAELSALLDGLPLAIELAASRSRIMSTRTMIERIGRRFELLTRPGSRHDRQSTMRTALDWSWELLMAPEQAALSALSVFEGGFTLHATEALLGATGESPSTGALDLLQALVQKSLVRRVAAERFDLLRTVHDYAAQRLADAGRTELVSNWHWRYFASMAPGNVDDADADNLVSATRRALKAADVGPAIAALVGAWSVLKRVGPIQVAGDLAKRAAQRAQEASQPAAQALWVAGCADIAMGRAGEALTPLRQALAEPGVADALAAQLHRALAESLGRLGELQLAEGHLVQAFELAQRLRQPQILLEVLNERGAWQLHRSRLAESRLSYQEAHALALELNDRRWMGGLLGNLGAVEHMLGHEDAAREHYETAIAHAQATGDRRWEGNTRCNLGLLHQQEGRVAQAEEEFDAALAAARHLGHRRLESTVACNLGLLLESQGRHVQAVRQFRAAADVAAEISDPRSEGQARGYLGLSLARLSEHADAAAAFDAGARLLEPLGDALSLGLLCCAQADAAILAARPLDARRALEAAERGLQETDAGSRSELSLRIEEVRARLAGGASQLP